MIDPNLKLTIKHDDDSTFTDYTDEMVDFLNDPVAMTVTTGDYVYIGYRKPFNAVYFEMKTANTNAADLSVEYYDGTSWVTADYHDQTNAMANSGLVSWDKSDMNAIEIDSVSKYYVRVSLSADSSAMEIHGANIIFSDDKEMKQEFFEISDPGLLPSGFDSHIPKHVAARNEIIQELRNRGNQKYNSNNVKVDINAFDLHDVFQIREAATYLALSKVFFNLSDNPEDNWFRKFEEYHNKYEKSISLYNLDIDTDDDGISDQNEKENKYKVVRLNR